LQTRSWHVAAPETTPPHRVPCWFLARESTGNRPTTGQPLRGGSAAPFIATQPSAVDSGRHPAQTRGGIDVIRSSAIQPFRAARHQRSPPRLPLYKPGIAGRVAAGLRFGGARSVPCARTARSAAQGVGRCRGAVALAGSMPYGGSVRIRHSTGRQRAKPYAKGRAALLTAALRQVPSTFPRRLRRLLRAPPADSGNAAAAPAHSSPPSSLPFSPPAPSAAHTRSPSRRASADRSPTFG